ncbi:MAG: LAGLIDADG family homing endonuclease, partial [Methanosarcinales archaeon]
MPRSIQTIFQEFVEKKVPIFKDRNALTSHFTPETIPHRDKQINDLATILAPSLKGGRPSNIFVYGLTGTGKCVIGPTLVYLANPGPVSIQSIVDNNRSKLIEKSLDYSIYSPSRSLIVYSIGNKLNIVKDKIIYLYKEKAPEKLVKIKTTSGREIITSLKHPFQILKNGILGFKNSIHLKKNDFIAIPRIIPVERRSTHLSFTKNFYEVNSGFVLVKDGCNPIKKINKSDEDLAEFLGIMIGEGTCRYYGHYYIAITNKNPLIIEKIRKIFDRFKLGYRIQESKKQPGLKEIIVSSKTFYYYLKEVLGYPVNKLSHQKEVPKIIFSSSINIRSAFLRGLFETDGYISKRDPVIEYSTSSPTLSNQVLYLLLNFGIVGRLKVKEKERKHFRIIVSGKQFLKKFKKKIGFMSKEKTRRLKQHLKKKDNTNVDVIPNIG